MHRFKTSKYRNAAAKTPKREYWFTDINVGNLKLSCGNHIKASSSFMAFNVDQGGGGCLSVIALDDVGRREKGQPLVQMHSDFVTDMDFSPFDDRLLATSSYDCTIKLWQLPEGGIEETSLSPVTVFPQQPGRVENILCHPSASGVLASTCSKTVTVWDVDKGQEKYSLNNHKESIQSLSWKEDGSLLATSSKDKKIRIFDPRTSICTGETAGLGGIKDSRVIWLGNRNHVLGTGFSMMRERQLAVWDIHNLRTPLQTVNIDNNTGILMPFYDADSDMLLLAGKGDSTILYFEVKENGDQYLNQVSCHVTEEQHKGMAMVPKLALDVMSCEVVRLLQLTKNSIVPISYCVPRKNIKEYNEDLFPDTLADEPAMTAEQWCNGHNTLRSRVSMNPDKASTTSTKPSLKPNYKPGTAISEQTSEKSEETKMEEPGQSLSDSANNSTVAGSEDSPVTPKKTFSGVRSSKFRHISGIPRHKSNNIENIRNLSMSTFGDCDGLQVNKEFVAFPLSGPGGQIAVLPQNKPCRLPDSGLPVVQCGSLVMDFVFDPLDVNRMAVACETGLISIWQIPPGGLTEIIDKPIEILRGHFDKPNIVRYHPMAENLLTSAAYDMSVKLWDINTAKSVITLQGHEEQVWLTCLAFVVLFLDSPRKNMRRDMQEWQNESQTVKCPGEKGREKMRNLCMVFSLAWSTDGKRLATVCRDKKLRLFDPRAKTTPIAEGPGPEGSRGARITWGGSDGNMLIVSGFDIMSNRIVSIYDSINLSEPLSTVEINMAPSILIPFYDEDANVVLLSGKGDAMVYAYEVSHEHPHLFELTHYRATDPFQAVAFFDKRVCNVREVEFARAVKLSKTNLEQIMFQVPRIKTEYFQDDLFPDTRVTWEASLKSEEWFAGENREQRKISLKPPDMKPLSEAPKLAPSTKKYDSTRELDEYKSDERKKEELVTAMVEKLGNYDEDPLPQDLMEGVDDDEWDD